jgi:hypothetical protein
MFYWKFADEGDNTVKKLNIYNVEGDNKLSPGLSTTFDNQKCVENPGLLPSLYFLKLKIILLTSAKQKIQIINIFV